MASSSSYNWVTGAVAPYTGSTPTKRGAIFDWNVETGRVPSSGTKFVKAKRARIEQGGSGRGGAGSVSDLINFVANAPDTVGERDQTSSDANYRIMYQILDIASKASERAWLGNQLVFVQDQTWGASTTSGPSPFENPEVPVNSIRPLEFVMDEAEGDPIGHFRVFSIPELNNLLQRERALPKSQRYPEAQTLLNRMGISFGGVVNNTSGGQDPAQEDNHLVGGRIINLCVKGDVPVRMGFDFSKLPAVRKYRGTKLYLIIRRIDRDNFHEHGLLPYYVTDPMEGTQYTVLPKNSGYVNSPFQVIFYAGFEAPPLSMTQYKDDHGMLRQGKVIYIGQVHYDQVHPSVHDPRGYASDQTLGNQVGMSHVILHFMELEFA